MNPCFRILFVGSSIAITSASPEASILNNDAVSLTGSTRILSPMVEA